MVMTYTAWEALSEAGLCYTVTEHLKGDWYEMRSAVNFKDTADG